MARHWKDVPEKNPQWNFKRQKGCKNESEKQQKFSLWAFWSQAIAWLFNLYDGVEDSLLLIHS